MLLLCAILLLLLLLVWSLIIFLSDHPHCPYCDVRYRQVVPYPTVITLNNRIFCDKCNRSNSLVDIWTYNIGR